MSNLFSNNYVSNYLIILFAVDIIGKIVGVGPLENAYVQGSTFPMRNIDIINLEYSLACTYGFIA